MERKLFIGTYCIDYYQVHCHTVLNTGKIVRLHSTYLWRPLYTEWLHWDPTFWLATMPRLREFYFTAILPKLALPTVFLQSDAMATVYFAACFMWLLFEGNVYFFGKPGGINDGWIRYVRVRQWRLLDAFSSMRSLSVLVSAMGTTRTTKSPTGLEERDRGFMMRFIFCIKCDCHVVERERDGRVGGQRCSVTSSWRCCLGA